MENNGKAGPTVGYGPNNSQGPGLGEFYNDNYTNVHTELANGGLALRPGSGEVATTGVDVKEYFSNGIRYLNNSTGLSTRDYTVYKSTSADPTKDFTFNKGVGLGDLEVLCDVPDDREVGNRIWSDINANGIQDPNELGIDGVTVKLVDAAGALVATAVTSGGGQYYFRHNPADVDDSTTDNVGLVYRSGNGLALQGAYTVTVDLTQARLGGNAALTQANAQGNTTNDQTDLRDSDATASNSIAVIRFIAPGQNSESNHTLDIGIQTVSVGSFVWWVILCQAGQLR